MTWNGTHTYGTSEDCSSISGSWAAPTFGTSPGAQGTFVSDTDCSALFVEDIDGNLYEPVTIGTQVWLASNLNVSHYRNGDEIPQVQDPTAWQSLTTGAWCYNMNDSDNGPIYGKLYNWYAVNDPRGLAPEGWHVATDAEWEILGEFAGGNSVAGTKLRSITGWNPPNAGATNEFGFSALPGGNRTGGNFFNPGERGFWWTATSSNSSSAWYRAMYSLQDFVNRNAANTTFGFSVRCLQD
ncbi:MAG: fibrobacter succinogenes major paralogous domain-containing protein [Aquaticitalea sp.]